MSLSSPLALSLLLVAAFAAARASAAPTPLRLLTDARATCLDGTLSGYYVEPAVPGTENATKWVVFLQGGGECASNASCTAATHNSLGSSKYFAPSLEFGEGEYFASGEPSNPFASWNRVDVPYCSQDLHSGTRLSTSPETFGLFFSGHIIFEAILQALKDEFGLGAATEVILSGASAGGIGAWINANSLVTGYVPAGCRVTVAPVAGMYFFAFPYMDVNHTESTLVDFREQAWPGNVALWQSYIDPACAAGLGARSYACMLSNYSYPFIKAAAFIVEAQTDQVQLEAHDWLPGPDHQDAPERAYMAAWRDNMTIALAQTAPAAGFFNPACYIHTSFSTSGPLIGGDSYLSAFARWYAGGGEVRLADACGVTCNPTCPH
jgi:hypothetical protein